ncbi:DUF3320 domain-containing protein [Rothia sp. 11254D007CT]
MSTQPNLRRPADDLLALLSQRLNEVISKLTQPYSGVLKNSGVKIFEEKATGTWVDLLHAQDIVESMKAASDKKFQFDPNRQTFKRYSPADPQYQLKILKMHNAGSLQKGFFKNINSRIPDLGISLGRMRNNHCHFEEHSAEDIKRALDNARELLTALNDPQGAQQVEELFTTYATDLGLTNPADYQKPKLPPEVEAELAKEAQQAHTDEARTLQEKPQSAADKPIPKSEPRAQKLDDIIAAAGTIDAELYEPWQVESLGQPDHLERIRARGHAARVRSVIAEITEHEAPISMDRLTRLTAYAFGIARINSTMRKRIRHQISATEELFIDDHKFVWPDTETYATYSAFRYDPEGYQRPITDISPRELANAIRYHRTTHTTTPGSEDEIRAVMTYYNRTRLTSAVQQQIHTARQELGE